MISLSENAVSKIKQLSAEKPGLGLRVKVVGGGCSGLQYRMELDYSEELMASGFKVVNPNAKRTCGCGESFVV